jgi:hypothetical protein
LCVTQCLLCARASNANWVGDLGRVKSGDQILLEVAEDLCLGSRLAFKRTMMEASDDQGG